MPILQLAQAGKSQSEQKLFDLSQTVVRPGLISVPGAAIPYPYGGKVRRIQIDLDPAALQSRGLSAQDVSNALAAQNQILPAGTIKIGTFQYNVRLNDAAETIEDLNNLPIKTVDGATIYIRDVGQVRDGSSPQTNVVHVDGSRRGAVDHPEERLGLDPGHRRRRQGAPADPEGDPARRLQDHPAERPVAVREGRDHGGHQEGVIAAALTSVMILLFLGSWRSTVIIAVSIPLAVLAAIAGLSADRPDAEHHDPGRPGPGPSASWSTTPP